MLIFAYQQNGLCLQKNMLVVNVCVVRKKYNTANFDFTVPANLQWSLLRHILVIAI